MLKMRLNTICWMFTLTCILTILFVQRWKQQREVNSLRGELESLRAELLFPKATSPNFADLDFYLPESANGLIDDTMIYKNLQSKQTDAAIVVRADQ